MKKNGKVLKVQIIFDQRAEQEAGLWEAVEAIRSLGHTIVTQQISQPEDATRYAAEAVERNADRIVAVGGDGMLNLVINGVLPADCNARQAVGLIPFGTANDFAGAGNIPREDYSAALDLVLRAPPQVIDVGQVNETYFINVIAGGFPAEAAADASRKAKEVLGKFAYFLTGLANIANLEAQHVQFTAPGFEWSGAVYAFALGNGRQAGGGFSVAPKAVVNDGLLDLMIIPEWEEGIIELVSEYSRLKRHDPTDHIFYAQIPRLKLESRETIHLNLDGEPVEGTDFDFQAHPGRLRFCLPPESPLLIEPVTD